MLLLLVLSVSGAQFMLLSVSTSYFISYSVSLLESGSNVLSADVTGLPADVSFDDSLSLLLCFFVPKNKRK